MTDITDTDILRMRDAFVAKHRRPLLFRRSGSQESFEEWLEGVIGTVVVDTVLIIGGGLRIEDFEEAG